MFRTLVFVIFIRKSIGDYCGNDQVPYGIELHHSGILRLLCSKPNCFDKMYTDCPERALSHRGCPKPSQWVGGFQTTIDNKLLTMCCELDLIEKYSKIRYKQIRIRRGEYFEGEEKVDEVGDVTNFDVIKDIRMYRDQIGEPYYNLTINSFNCAEIPQRKPNWYKSRQWPYFQK